ncbi:branched-chain amino acid ABC transporter substrate-binding protein [Telmatocola sphagniphila]|uniref:Branched-chain amino acid ABC transporter substrate-binding protein n=1 Tax=Telmatocola sphagniphila TaxID=1123043 RepID=A0A8E6B669_9BACT|nr:branched-chain amino acid ABC transporter substrate-binding protein [Telmatocola sphagniphila]QVL32117.1 branched-chain amino acid ABC transporter substrate-binding protein [Telmatocola sphagniphila]
MTVKKPNWQIFSALGICLTLSVLITGCDSGGSKPSAATKASTPSTAEAVNPSGLGNPDVIKIVSSLPRTGSAKGQTDTIVNGIRMAFEEAGNKVGSFKIEYEDLDDATAADGKWTPERETANANKAIQDPDVMIFLGPYNSGAASTSMPILNKASLLMVSPACTAIGLTKKEGAEPGEPEKYRPAGTINFTRVVPADDIQGPVAADFAKSKGVKTVCILDDNEVYGKGLATIFKDRCEEIQLKVLGKQESIDYKQSDFRTLMKRIKNQFNPDCIYFGGTSQTGAGQIAKDMVAEGLEKTILIIPDGCYEAAFIQAAGADVFKKLTCYCTFGGMPPDQLKGKGAEFVANYKKRFNADPEGYAVYGYECGKVALEAIKKAGKKDRAAITQAALSIKDFKDGALGTWSFDKNGDTTSTTLSISTIKPNAKGTMDFDFVKLLELQK